MFFLLAFLSDSGDILRGLWAEARLATASDSSMVVGTAGIDSGAL
jgi:hypothetical protein